MLWKNNILLRGCRTLPLLRVLLNPTILLRVLLNLTICCECCWTLPFCCACYWTLPFVASAVESYYFCCECCWTLPFVASVVEPYHSVATLASAWWSLPVLLGVLLNHTILSQLLLLNPTIALRLVMWLLVLLLGVPVLLDSDGNLQNCNFH